MSFFPYAVAAWIFVVGLFGIVRSRRLVHTVISLSVVQSSTYVLLLCVGYRTGAGAPIFLDYPPETKAAVDPIVQALALTDIVVSAATTALLLAIATQVWRAGKSDDPDALRSRKT